MSAVFDTRIQQLRDDKQTRHVNYQATNQTVINKNCIGLSISNT